jgi:CRISPR-associated protein Cmr2
MSQHVLLLHLGPIQDFIVQARRTRDLWFGSHVLSEVSKAAARAMAGCPGTTLIFPALDAGDPGLGSRETVRRGHGEPPYNVANKIVALVDAGDPGAVARRGRAAARSHLLDLGLNVLTAQAELIDRAARDTAEEQLCTLLEVRAVWAPVEEEGYAAARRRAEADLAARKTLHAFAPWEQQRGGAFKSSLDGARETVLARGPREHPGWKELRIGEREELDAVGLLKRAGGQTDQFVPVPTVGMAAWIARAAVQAPRPLADLRRACEANHFQQVNPIRPWLEAFPYDAQVLLAERWQPYFEDLEQPRDRDARERVAEKARAFGHDAVRPLLDAMKGGPFPYVACLVADGDRMGKTIDHRAEEGHEGHRDLSRALAEFAAKAYQIVEQQHRGILVYAGGDDVLGFVCLQDALSCAHALQQQFAEIVGRDLPDSAARPTLSCGLGVGHVLESLGHLLHLGREAERLAKHGHAANGDGRGPDGPAAPEAGRNALAVVMDKHTGARSAWRCGWPDAPLARLRRAIELLGQKQLSTGKIHEIERMLARLPEPPLGDEDDDGHWSRVLAGECHLILSRNQSGILTPEIVHLDLKHASYADSHRVVGEWAARMQIALHLHRADQAAPMRWPKDMP